MPPESLTGFILAGGKSSRMGVDKAWLPMGQRTLIERVILRLRDLPVDRIGVIGSSQHLKRLKELPVDLVLTDFKPDQGPLMGVYTGLMHTQTRLNLFFPCDMPWIERRLIEQLIPICRDEVEVVASLHPKEGIQPFPLVCQVKACSTLRVLLEGSDRSLHTLLKQPIARWVKIEDTRLWRSFINFNTPAEYSNHFHEAALPSGS